MTHDHERYQGDRPENSVVEHHGQSSSRRPDERFIAGEIDHVDSPPLATAIAHAFFNHREQIAHFAALNAMQSGSHDGVPSNPTPLFYRLNDEGEVREFSHPVFCGTIAGSLSRIVVLSSTEGSENPEDHIALYVDGTHISSIGIQSLDDGVFRGNVRARGFVDDLSDNPRPNIEFSMTDGSPSGRVRRGAAGEIGTLTLRKSERPLREIEDGIRIAQSIRATSENISDPENPEVRAGLGSFMLRYVGHENSNIRQGQGMPGDAYQSPIAIGVSTDDNMAVSLRGTIINHQGGYREHLIESTNPSDYQASVVDLESGSVHEMQIVNPHRYEDWFFIDLVDPKDPDFRRYVKYRLTPSGVPKDIHLNDNPIRAIDDLMRDIRVVSGCSLSELIEADHEKVLNKQRDLSLDMIRDDDEKAVLAGRMINDYIGVGSGNDDGLPQVVRERGGEQVKFDNVIGTVMIDNTICHIRSRHDGTYGNPDDFLVVMADIGKNSSGTGIVDIPVQWVWYDGINLHLGFCYPYDDQSKIVKVSCDMSSGEPRDHVISRDNIHTERLMPFDAMKSDVLKIIGDDLHVMQLRDLAQGAMRAAEALSPTR